MPQWTQGHVYLFKLPFLFSSDNCPEVALLDHMVVPFLMRNVYTGFHTGYTNLHSHLQCTRRNSISPHSHQHLLFLTFLTVANLVGVRWYFIVVLTCISLMACDVEHLFMCVSAVWMSSLEKRLFRASAHCFIGVLFCFWVVWIYLFILGINPLWNIWFADIFTHFVGCPFISFCWWFSLLCRSFSFDVVFVCLFSFFSFHLLPLLWVQIPKYIYH